ncbi:MAG: PD40 domain-containing protein [Actinobacteria bacterium]|nr:PD40 domain-containing protein [Actinomycetota bacterium]
MWWPAKRRLVVVVGKPGKLSSPTLYLMRPDGSERVRLALRKQTPCEPTSEVHPEVLGDGRVAFVEQCWGEGDPTKSVRRLALDGASGQIRPLVPYRLRFQMGSFTYAPDGKRGVINDSDGLYEQLRRLTPSGLELIELPFDRVGYPRWSPAGDRIALDAVPHAGGGSPSERVDAERNLYTLSGRTFEPRLLLENIGNAGISAWSPDGRWLAVVIAPQDEPEGLWLVDSVSGKRCLLLNSSHLGVPAWISARALVVTIGRFAYLAPRNGPSRRIGFVRLTLPSDVFQLSARASPRPS